MEKTVLNQQKKSKASTRTVAVDASAVNVVPFDETRTALVLSTHTTTVFLSLRREAADVNGIRLAVADGPLTLSLLQHGAAVHGPWSCISPAGAGTLGILETSNDAP